MLLQPPCLHAAVLLLFCNTSYHHRPLCPPAYPHRRWHILPILPLNGVGLDFYYSLPRPTKLPNGLKCVPMPFGRWQWNWPMPRRKRQVSPQDREVDRVVRLVVLAVAVVTVILAEQWLIRHHHPYIGSMRMPRYIIHRHYIMDFICPILQLTPILLLDLLYLLLVQPTTTDWIHNILK